MLKMKLFLVLFSVGVFSLGGALSPAFGSGFYLNHAMPRRSLWLSREQEQDDVPCLLGSLANHAQRLAR